MRFYTYGVGAQLVLELEMAGAVERIVHDGADIIHLGLLTGESLMIHLIDSTIPLYEIKNILMANTQAGHHTLFILWADMLLPDDGGAVNLEDWHSGLLATYGERIYAYKVYMEQLTIFPVYFQRYHTHWVTHYGAALDVGGLQCHYAQTDVFGLHGEWRVASFDGDPEAYHRWRAAHMGHVLPDELKASYALLQIDLQADRPMVKTAYRRLARQYHPDLNTDRQDAHDQMQAINQAYAAILNHLENKDKN